MKQPSRRFQWIPSVNHKDPQLQSLQDELLRYYAGNRANSYYQEIDFTKDNWIKEEEYRYLYERIKEGNQVLEVGCGRANVLTHLPSIESKYIGIDFDRELLNANRKAYENATFVDIDEPEKFPLPDSSIDIVFSTFVLEHCVFPSAFLDECSRVLKPNGQLLILCPDFLGCSRMTSQKAGYTVGTGRDKLRQGKVLDAIVTGYDTRIRMFVATWVRRCLARRSGRFYVNLAPLCFSEQFQPDFDAVYLTYENEIRAYLADWFRWVDLPTTVHLACRRNRLILVHGTKFPLERL